MTRLSCASPNNHDGYSSKTPALQKSPYHLHAEQLFLNFIELKVL
jgi:hypothetical protein